MSGEFTTSAVIVELMVEALTGPTVAGANVFSPRTWPVDLGLLPILLVQAPEERKTSLGPNAPSFDVVTTVRVIGRLTFKASVNDAAAAAALAALQTFQRQIEIAVINAYDLMQVISEFPTIDTKLEVKSEGDQPIAELTMDFAVKFYQGPEAFAQPVTNPLEEFAAYGDLLNVFDPNGTYTPPFDYTVPDAPRTTGPDGRVEIGAVIELPQE